MFRSVPFRIKLERNCSIDRRVLAVRVEVHAKTDLGAGLQKNSGALFKLVTVVTNAVGLQIGLTTIGIDCRRTGMMERFETFDGFDLDRLHITIDRKSTRLNSSHIP